MSKYSSLLEIQISAFFDFTLVGLLKLIGARKSVTFSFYRFYVVYELLLPV